MDRFARAVTGHPYRVLGAVALLTLLAVSRIVSPTTGEFRLGFDPSVDRLVQQDDESRRFYEHVRRLFGSDEILVLALVDEQGVFTAGNLRIVDRLTERIQQVDGVHHVVSLSNALNIRSVNGDLEMEPFLAKVPDDPAELARIREEALANPIYAGNLVSRDGRATALFVYLDDFSDVEFLDRGIDQQIARLAGEIAGDVEIFLTGSAHLKAETTRMVVRDLTRILPAISVVLIAVASVSFRSVPGVVLPFLTVFVALLWTLGVIAWSGRPINLVTIIIPPLILTVGFAYAVHVVSAYYDAVRGRARGEAHGEGSAAREALAHVALPVLLTGLTTAAGFLSLTLSPLNAVREFGAFCVVAVVATVVAALTLPPALLELLPVRAPREPRAGEGRFDRLARRLAAFDLRHRLSIFVCGALVVAVSLVGVSRIRVSMNAITNFPAQSSVRRHFETINQNLEGSNRFYVVLQADYPDAFKEPVTLAEIRRLQAWLEEQPEIGGSTSLADYVMLINRGFHDDPDHLALPESKRLVTQLLFFGANDELENVVDSRYQTASIVVRSRVIDSGEVGELVDRIEARLADLPEHLEARVTGSSVLVNRGIDAISRGQALSLSAAFVLIYAVLALLFTSFRVGLIALIPNALPVLAYFGLLGLTGVTLNPTTSLVACIVLGIAVDDTIHFLTQFSAAARSHADEARGAEEALATVVRPVTYTSAALCLGFLVMTTSQLRNQVEFGALASFTLALAWLVDVTLTPALASRLRIVTLWDVLGLDLGEAPQRSIPLFASLRKSQAKIVALMTSIRTFPKGHKLFEAGEPGDHMYVVLDGKMRVSVPRETGRLDVATLERGDAAGEVALFHGRRTADVEALTDVRLLRFTRGDLERLRRRYPRIGAQVLENLSHILADRLAEANIRRAS